MGYLLSSGEVGKTAYNQREEQMKTIAESWGNLGFLDGLTGHVRDNIAQLYENQAAWMLNESTDTVGSTGSFETVAFPMIRRVFSKLLANEIVSVQALNMPIGKLFYYNPKISATQTAYDGAYQNAAGTPQSGRTQFQAGTMYEGFYGNTDMYGVNNGYYDLSKGKATEFDVALQPTAGYVTGDKYVAVLLTGLTMTAQGTIINAQGQPVDTESFLASMNVYSNVVLSGTSTAGGTVIVPAGKGNASLPFSLKKQAYTKSIADAGKVELIIDLTTPAANGYVGLTPAAAPTFFCTYRTYASLEENSEMTEVTFELAEVTVSVEGRKMRATWTPELSQDVKVFQNIDAEAELTAILSEQIAAEIDREILRDLRNGAAWTARWDYNGLRNQTGTYYGVQKDWNQTLITKINQISAQIRKATLKGGVSWLVVSSEISAILDDLEYFHASNAAGDEDKYNMGIERIGSIHGRYQVYVDPYAPANTILLGHKGNSILETGYIYAPYVPLQLTNVLTDTRDFKLVKGISTRYAKKMVNNRFYGKILVDGVVTF